MAIELDHLIIPARDKVAAAQLVAELLDVRWSPRHRPVRPGVRQRQPDHRF